MAFSIVGVVLFLVAAYPCMALPKEFPRYEESVNPPPMLAPPEELVGQMSVSSLSSISGSSVDAVPKARPTDYLVDERDLILATHNDHRRAAPAGNMKAMVWDSVLAAMAQGWSDECIFAHGNPENTSPFGSVGQNLYIRWSTKGDPPAPKAGTAVTKWHDEIAYYMYEDTSCSHVCGHYTQVVWAKTTHVGCGKTFCETAVDGNGNPYKNAWIVTCNYGPAGNYRGQRPYIEGAICANCSHPSKCEGGLCKECDLSNSDCSCRLDCGECGIQNTTDGACQCMCRKGTWGNNCQTTCVDTHSYCGKSPGWPNKKYCNRHPSIPTYCPLMCGLCEAAEPGSVCG